MAEEQVQTAAAFPYSVKLESTAKGMVGKFEVDEWGIEVEYIGKHRVVIG